MYKFTEEALILFLQPAEKARQVAVADERVLRHLQLPDARQSDECPVLHGLDPVVIQLEPLQLNQTPEHVRRDGLQVVPAQVEGLQSTQGLEGPFLDQGQAVVLEVQLLQVGHREERVTLDLLQSVLGQIEGDGVPG